MRKSMTYGTLPSREEFETAFDALFDSDDSRVTHGAARFTFTNDPRVGTCMLTANELWCELEKAQKEWYDWTSTRTEVAAEAAGQWCSDVLGILGFEWI